MIQYRFYIGTEAGKNWKHSFWKDKVFTREEVEENIETVRKIYNLERIEKEEVDETIDAYTLFDGIGFWQGVKEHTIVLEIIISSMDAEWFAEALTSYCKQDCVLFTSQRVDWGCR